MKEVTIKNSGATFTPTELADFLADKLIGELDLNGLSSLTVLDPACGEGELLNSFARKFKVQNNQLNLEIKGFDTNQDYLHVSQSILSDFKNYKIDIRQEDFLESNGACVQAMDLFSQQTVSEYADVIIANPPYVRTQILGADKAQEIAKRFNLKGRVDLYYPFLIAMTNVLKKGGLIGVITSNRYLFTKSGESIRKFLLENYELLEVIDLGDTKIFDAAVLPAIFIGRKKSSNHKLSQPCRFAKIYEERISPDIKAIPSDSIYKILSTSQSGVYDIEEKRYAFNVGLLKHSPDKSDIWQMTTSDENNWIEKIKTNSSFLIGDRFKVRVGIKSCADNVFLRESWENESIVPESDLFKKLISQENIQRWGAQAENDLKVLYPHYAQSGKRSVVDINNYPKAKAYFELHKEQLRSRKYLIDAGRKWYEMWVPQNPALWPFPKLVFPDISIDARFYYDEAGAVVNGNCYWIVAQNEAEKELLFLIQGVSNSNLMSRYHDLCFNNKLYSGRRRYFSQYIEKYPIPNPQSEYSKEIVSIVKELNELSSQNKEFRELETKLNVLVEKSFGF
ncbi:Eco57I restriction-modification methylase domain-containing protein [Parabacteroides sp. FAFU027]|uniref:Eco57I restriction-modification methylase domain-containing protein n=1 Tax=Parabacteroides sp. FAFU027 TaxID=2922715 RepID=UPI001FAE9BE8|nr:N-6 DNA methylase [Parabacteroides sp. FAFU027]